MKQRLWVLIAIVALACHSVLGAMTDDLIAYYPLNESSGDAFDVSGNGLDFIEYGTVDSCDVVNGEGRGKFHQYSAEDQFQRTNTENLNASKNLTISMWFKFDPDESGYQDALYYTSPTDSATFELFNWDGSKMGGWMEFETGGINPTITHTPVTNATYFAVFTYNAENKTAYLYLNGTKSDASSSEQPLKQSGNNLVILGGGGGGTYLAGCIAHVGIWERVLSDVEIDQLAAGASNSFYPFVEPCTPNWSCTGYGSCVNGSQACNAASDLNLCGESYTGDYSEFTPQACSESPFTYSSDDLAPAVLNGLAKGIITIGAFATVIVLVGLASYFGVLRWFK
jgi:hypothetical protein